MQKNRQEEKPGEDRGYTERGWKVVMEEREQYREFVLEITMIFDKPEVDVRRPEVEVFGEYYGMKKQNTVENSVVSPAELSVIFNK